MELTDPLAPYVVVNKTYMALCTRYHRAYLQQFDSVGDAAEYCKVIQDQCPHSEFGVYSLAMLIMAIGMYKEDFSWHPSVAQQLDKCPVIEYNSNTVEKDTSAG